MTQKEKKPPISISELKGGKKEEAEKGALSYINKKDNKNPLKKLRVDWAQVLISCIISIVLISFIILQVAPSKESVNDLLVRTNELSDEIATISSEVATVSSGVASVSSRLSNEVSRIDGLEAKAESNPNLVSTEELSKLSNKVDNLSTLVSHYGNLATKLRLELDETEIWKAIDKLEKSLDYFDAGITWFEGVAADLEKRVKDLEK